MGGVLRVGGADAITKCSQANDSHRLKSIRWERLHVRSHHMRPNLSLYLSLSLSIYRSVCVSTSAASDRHLALRCFSMSFDVVGVHFWFFVEYRPVHTEWVVPESTVCACARVCVCVCVYFHSWPPRRHRGGPIARSMQASIMTWRT